MQSSSSTMMGQALVGKQAVARTGGRAQVVVEAAKKMTSRKRAHYRIRNKVSGTAERPRLSVYRSNKNIYAQVIDDVEGKTICSVNSLQLKGELSTGATVDAATTVGKKIAEAATAAGVTKVSFDRGGFVYHGRVAAVAEAAREGGLTF
ncbi:unnamed protein product [Pedinophyceae sp. YPF-701]|nr:unnamed protein product [Pedinophyceae sp. YPF-701]